VSGSDRIRIGHGGGGRLARAFLDSEIRTRFTSPLLASLDDAAILTLDGVRLAFTTDGFVVKPRDVPGGDLGKLAVCGTVNDLAVSGARPLYLSLSLIVEEGLAVTDLGVVLDSVARAADRAGVEIVCGDTKVVGRGEVDGVFLITAGVGVVDPGARLGRERIEPGDRLIVSGSVGDHGAAVLAARGELGEMTGITSDCAPVTAVARALLGLGPDLRFMRDPTRGGLLGAAVEMVSGLPVGLSIDEPSVPVASTVEAVCGLAGLDPLMLACEGRVAAVVSPGGASRAVEALGMLEDGGAAAVIGEVVEDHPGRVAIRTSAGTSRLVVLPEEDPLPRIC